MLQSGIPREEIFLTTKLPNQDHQRVAQSLEESLNKLGLNYVDLYLMHWPLATRDGETIPFGQSPTFVETWKEMEKLLATGKVRSIGVSNFSIKNLDILLAEASVVPATNQVELHPCLPSFELKEYCDKKGIVLTAYSPLGAHVLGLMAVSAASNDDMQVARRSTTGNLCFSTILTSCALRRSTSRRRARSRSAGE